MYLNIIITVWVVLTLLILIANMPNRKIIDKIENERQEHNEYQKETNEEVLRLHREMLEELKAIYNELPQIRNSI